MLIAAPMIIANQYRSVAWRPYRSAGFDPSPLFVGIAKPEMPLVTYYVAMPFRYLEDGQIAAGEPQECRDSFKARSIAAAMATDPNNCGAIAFSRTGDPAIGEFENAMVVARLGEVDGAVM